MGLWGKGKRNKMKKQKQNCKVNRGVRKKITVRRWSILYIMFVPTFSEQSKVFSTSWQQRLQNCSASVRARLLGAVEYFGWEHDATAGEGKVMAADWASCTMTIQCLWATPDCLRLLPGLNLTQRQQPLEQSIDGHKHNDFTITTQDYPISSKSTFGATAPSCALSVRIV